MVQYQSKILKNLAKQLKKEGAIKTPERSKSDLDTSKYNKNIINVNNSIIIKDNKDNNNEIYNEHKENKDLLYSNYFNSEHEILETKNKSWNNMNEYNEYNNE